MMSDLADSNFDNGFEKVPSEKDYMISSGGGVEDVYRAPGLGPAPVKSREMSAKSEGCCWVKGIDPRVVDLIYWRDARKTGVVFGSAMVLLLSLALFSVLSVIAHLALVTLTITISFRIYKNIMVAVQKTGEGHPFQRYLEMDMSLSSDTVHRLSDQLADHFIRTITELRRLFLVEDMVDSLKFGLLLWVLTYVGACFNGMTLIIFGNVLLFTVPKFYDTYRVEIDQYISIAKSNLQSVCKQVQEKIPGLSKKKQA